MATSYLTFGSTGVLRIEVDGTGAPGDLASDLGTAIYSVASSVASGASKLSAEQKPAEIWLICGLKALAGGGYVIGQGLEKVNFQLKLVWKTQEGSQMPQQPPAESEGQNEIGF